VKQYLLRTLLYGLGAGISLVLPMILGFSSYSGDLVSLGIFFTLFLVITILFFFKEIRRRTDLEAPEAESRRHEKILLFILLAVSGVGLLSIWVTSTLFRPDAGQGAIFLVVCIPIDCVYVALALGILSRLFIRRGSETKPYEQNAEVNYQNPKQD
jgi:hypothetical protein